MCLDKGDVDPELVESFPEVIERCDGFAEVLTLFFSNKHNNIFLAENIQT